MPIRLNMIDSLIDRHIDFLDNNKMDIGPRHLIIKNINWSSDVNETKTTFTTGFRNFQLGGGARHSLIPSPIATGLQLISAVITHNSVKKRNLYINKWLSYSQLYCFQPSFCPLS